MRHSLSTSTKPSFLLSTNPTSLSDGQWEAIKEDVKVYSDKIMLPGLNLGIKKCDEPGKYTPGEAWEEFGDALIYKDQIVQLLTYGKILESETKPPNVMDGEALFHELLGMKSRKSDNEKEVSHYYIHSDETTFLRKMRKQPNIGYSLVTSSPFGPRYSKIIQRGSHSFRCLQEVGFRYTRIREQETQKFRVRLQAD